MKQIPLFRSLIRRSQRGIGLLEIMLGMAIVAALLVGVITMYKKISDNMKKNNDKAIVRAVKMAIESYKIDIGKYPEKLEELQTAPGDQQTRRRWQGPYAPEEYSPGNVIRDAFGNELEYKVDNAKNTYELHGWGPKGPGSDSGWTFAD